MVFDLLMVTEYELFMKAQRKVKIKKKTQRFCGLTRNHNQLNIVEVKKKKMRKKEEIFFIHNDEHWAIIWNVEQ